MKSQIVIFAAHNPGDRHEKMIENFETTFAGNSRPASLDMTKEQIVSGNKSLPATVFNYVCLYFRILKARRVCRDCREKNLH